VRRSHDHEQSLEAETSNVEGPKTKAAGIVDAAIQVGDDNAEIKRLASLPLEYERERKAAAQKLGIERVAVLDDLISVRSAAQVAPKVRARR
jgi:hypothetical protein